MTNSETPQGTLERLLKEWDAEVEQHGIWTSGHSIAARIVAALRASEGPREPDNVFWPPKDDAEEHLYEIRNGKNAEYVQTHVEELKALWAEGRQGTASQPAADIKDALTRIIAEASAFSEGHENSDTFFRIVGLAEAALRRQGTAAAQEPDGVVSETEYQNHLPWCKARRRGRLVPSACDCDVSKASSGTATDA